MNKESRIKEHCYHCGAPASTREHVPPKGFFPKGSDLITVPSCETHNHDKSHIDETMRIYLMACSPYSSSKALPDVFTKIVSGKERSISKINKISKNPIFIKLNENQYSYPNHDMNNTIDIPCEIYKTFEESILRALFYVLNKEIYNDNIFFFPYTQLFGYVRNDISFVRPLTEQKKIEKLSCDGFINFLKLKSLIDKNEAFIDTDTSTEKSNSTDYVFNYSQHILPGLSDAAVINVCLYRWYYFSGVFCDEKSYEILMNYMSDSIPVLEYNHLNV